MNATKTHRGSILCEQADIISHDAYEGDQFILRVQAERIAGRACAGDFVHIQCADELSMRRPISIMRVSASQGWVDFLYKVVGKGTQLLSQRAPGETLSIMGPIGQGFQPSSDKTLPLLIGGGVGMPPMIFLADSLRQKEHQPFVILGSEVPFPFSAEPSKIMMPMLPADVIATMPLLESWKITCRLASLQGYPGCYEGYVTDLARIWLSGLSKDEQQHVEIFSCGPTPMLKAVASLAREFNLPCQVSLEEYMACAVGGCAGCVVEVKTEKGPVMKRVCVDGPVFDAASVF